MSKLKLQNLKQDMGIFKNKKNYPGFVNSFIASLYISLKNAGNDIEY